MSDSINEQRCEHGQTRPHRGINLGFNEPRIDCPGPSVVTPLGQDERTPDELVELASEASLRIDALNAQTRATLNGDRCTHDSSSGDEGPVSDLVGPVVRWRCDGCGDVWYDDQALTSLRAEIITRSRSVPAAPSVSTDHTDESECDCPPEACRMAHIFASTGEWRRKCVDDHADEIRDAIGRFRRDAVEYLLDDAKRHARSWPDDRRYQQGIEYAAARLRAGWPQEAGRG